MKQDIRQLSIDTIRALAMDAVQKANAGHPGTAMALAPLAYTSFIATSCASTPRTRTGRTATASCFGGSRVHAAVRDAAPRGYDLPSRTSQQFRQWGSRTPGHPERGLTPGIEVTTGPLGQGIGERRRHGDGRAHARGALQPPRPRDRRPPHLRDLRRTATSWRASAQEAASLAGHFGLGKLIVCYDDNHITIDGTTALVLRRRGRRSGSRRTAGTFSTSRTSTTSTLSMPRCARRAPRRSDRRSSRVRSHIAYPAPNAKDTAKAHGAPLGEDEVRRRRGSMGFDPDRHFWCRTRRGRAHVARSTEAAPARSAWQTRFAAGARHTRSSPPDWDRRMRAAARPAGRERCRSLLRSARDRDARRGRHTSWRALQRFAPTMIGGAADSSSRPRQCSRARDVREGPCRPQRPLRHPRARDGRRSSTALAPTAGSSSRMARRS